MTRRKFVNICVSLLCCATLSAKDTTYVSGGIQHDGLLDWKPVRYHSNSYVDLSVFYVNDSNAAHFHSLRATTRGELTKWPLYGYESDFGGYGMSHLSVAATFDWGEITVGDVYGQFGNGLVLNLREDRAMGIDGALRGGKIAVNPYKGLYMTVIGGKQRRYWNCYKDGAFGWNYKQDAAIGGDVEIHIDQWSKRMQEKEMQLLFGGSYVSKYQAFDTVMTLQPDGIYMYNLPRWVGAGAVRAAWSMRGWQVSAEYAHKANDPCAENGYNYRDGHAMLMSVSYSCKGLSVLAQAKRSNNMAFRSDRQRIGTCGRYNDMPPFTHQHTYALPALRPYVTQYAEGEWAFQGEVMYSAPRRTGFGGKYGTTLRLGASHVRGKSKCEGEFYTDVHLELNKRISKNWWLNAMVMYQGYNQLVIEGHGGMIRSGIAVVDARVHIHDNVGMRGELQYLYSPHADGQWCFALYELSLFKHWTLSGEWMYNIGFAPDANNEHFYTVSATYSYKAHHVMAGYTKTQERYQCSGGVCRWVPRQEGVCVSYSYTW